MALELPKNPEQYPFHATLPVRIGDLIGGLHVGNSTLVSYLNETQMQLFTALGFPQLVVEGCMPMNRGLEMAFLAECRYGDVLDIGVCLESLAEREYTLACRLVNQATGQPVCEARMQMIFFDMQQGKRATVPAAFVAAWQRLAAQA